MVKTWVIRSVVVLVAFVLGVMVGGTGLSVPQEAIVVPAAQPESQPTKAIATQWQEVARWTGNGLKSTEPFEVGPEWRVQWTNKRDQEVLTIYVYRGQALAGVLANTLEAGSDTSYVYEAGRYHLQIHGSSGWEVVVETR